MRNHKFCFQQYGVRRPLRRRRLLARLDRRLVSAINRREKLRTGWHGRWWANGQEALAWEAYARENADAFANQGEMPF